MEQEVITVNGESEVTKLVFGGMPMARTGTVTIEKMPLNKLKLGKNSRLEISDDEIEGLMQSIKEEGLLQPIGAIKNGSGYEICYGNRRFLACSKLGMKTMPVIVHEKQKESDVDIKNLTENVQRRNISLIEIGRYIELLDKQGLTHGEAAIRLGVTKSFVASALDAFRNVPKEFREDIEINVGRTKKATRSTPGKISLKTTRTIIAAEKMGKINALGTKALFRAAKSNSDFRPENLPAYIKAVSSGKTDFIEEAATMIRIALKFDISEKHYNDLKKKYVEDGPFRSVSALMLGILKGEISQQIKVVGTIR